MYFSTKTSQPAQYPTQLQVDEMDKNKDKNEADFNDRTRERGLGDAPTGWLLALAVATHFDYMPTAVGAYAAMGDLEDYYRAADSSDDPGIWDTFGQRGAFGGAHGTKRLRGGHVHGS